MQERVDRVQRQARLAEARRGREHPRLGRCHTKAHNSQVLLEGRTEKRFRQASRPVTKNTSLLGDLLDEIGIGLELNSAGPAIEPILAALIGEAPPAALHTAAAGAVEALWDAELETEIRTELEGFRAEV